MGKLILLLMFYGLVACGKSGGGAPSVDAGGNLIPPAVDSTPHDYVIRVIPVNAGVSIPIRMHQLCNNGYVGVRDEENIASVANAGGLSGMGCAAARNVIQSATNNSGVDSLYVEMEVDGVIVHYQYVLPGQTYTFTRGY